MELITKSFASQCLSFPSRVDQVLSKISTVEEAKELLDQAVTMQAYVEQLKAGVEIGRPVAFGILKIKAKIGELTPAKSPKETGRGKKKTPTSGVAVFPQTTIAAYRKLAKHQDQLEVYYESIDDLPTQTGFLKQVTTDSRTAKEAKRESKRKVNRAKVAKVKNPFDGQGLFSTIVLDPPWDWGDESDNDQFGRAKPDYATMTIDQLMAMPIGTLADDDCHIYLWITNRSLPKGFQLLEEWGFRFVTCLTWPKPSFGMGNYFRGQTEHVLFGVKGSMLLKRKNASTLLPQWKRGGKHSAKPVEFYDFVESCSPGPYIELFSRVERADWTAWGESS